LLHIIYVRGDRFSGESGYARGRAVFKCLPFTELIGDIEKRLLNILTLCHRVKIARVSRVLAVIPVVCVA
ncbi:hypothetical protein, partial [Limnofasciculus baicalensis]